MHDRMRCPESASSWSQAGGDGRVAGRNQGTWSGYHQPELGGLPLAISLSEGLGPIHAAANALTMTTSS